MGLRLGITPLLLDRKVSLPIHLSSPLLLCRWFAVGCLFGVWFCCRGGGFVLGERLTVDKTSWFRITAFTPSDYVRERVKKGALVFVDGDVSIDKYNDEGTGKTLSSIRIVQSRVHVLRNPKPQEGAEI